MTELNLPKYSFKFKEIDNSNFIFDDFRRKYIKLTPEEWVRQNFIQYLISEKKYPKSLIAVEKEIMVNNLKKRFDAIIFNKKGDARVIIEFKAPNIKLKQDVFNQISIYNLNLRCDYLIVSNGLNHYCIKVDFNNNSFNFLDEIPSFDDINELIW